MSVSSMKIGVNCIAINSEHAGGLNSFIVALLDGFVKCNTHHQIILFVNKENEHLFLKFLSSPNFKTIRIKNPPLFLVRLEWKSIKLHSKTIYKFLKNIIYWKQTIRIDKNCDLLYTPTTVLYSYNSRIPNVLSMHDIQQVHFRRFFTKEQLLIRNITYDLSARKADFIQASSHYIKDDFLNYFTFLKSDRVHVINECINSALFRDISQRDVRSKYNLPESYLFYPAQLWFHKNHITLFRALRNLQRKGIVIPLVLTGLPFSAKGDLFNYIRHQDLKQVMYLGSIPFEDIIELYKRAKILVMTSLHESSSLPILEAAAAGIPIIASDIPPNVEMGKNLKLNLFEATNAENLAEVIQYVWNNQELVNSQVKYNNENLNYYTCENIAKKYIELFESIAK